MTDRLTTPSTQVGGWRNPTPDPETAMNAPSLTKFLSKLTARLADLKAMADAGVAKRRQIDRTAERAVARLVDRQYPVEVAEVCVRMAVREATGVRYV